MSWKLDKNKPICPQISERICVSVALGKYAPDERIPSVRDIALEAGVNPNTVQKALETLEQSNIIYSVRGSGWFVCEDTANAKTMLKSSIENKTKQFISDLEGLGMTKQEIYDYLGGILK